MTTAARPHIPRGVDRQRGVTLVELMVGMLIGMLAILVISQVLLVSEGQKRTTTGGSDAQTNGALSVFAIQRDVQTAGYGFTSSPSIIGCPISAQFNGATPTGFAGALAPVFITTEADRILANPAVAVGSGDSIRLLASSKGSYSVPTRVIPPTFAVAGQVVPVTAALGFADRDLALVAADATNPCRMLQVTGVPTAMSIPRADDPNGWNSPNPQAYGDGSVLVNLGTLVDNRYEINNGVLQLSSFDINNPNTRITRDIQSDIVSLRAFYGRDTSVPADGIVDVYDMTTPATNAEWLRVLSVRVIVVARSAQFERGESGVFVTPANPNWDLGATPTSNGTGVNTCGTSRCVRLDVGAADVADPTVDLPAKHYRYKIFETIVPLRNMLWSS
ncbi:MAG: PilW family protein [Burkholderiaceae bacterium]|nr:PilW family protein [Burkholderiaceae bacterium]